jgi:hypothetical protein
MSIIKLNNQAVKNATSFGSISSLGSMTFIKKLTASSSATLSFVDGSDGVTLDNSYKEYLFTFNNIHPQTLGRFQFNFSTDGGSTYNVTKTSTNFRAYHNEAGNDSGLEYQGADDLAQSTAYQTHGTSNIGNNNDECLSGYLQIFNPSSDTFVKHYIMRNNVLGSDYGIQSFVAGYGNTQSSVDAIRFQMGSGNIDAGDICLYGIA